MEKVERPTNDSFHKNFRIISSDSFKLIISKGKRINTRQFTLFILKNKKGYPRLGVSVSKKISKKAVVRNKIKRLIRESFRTNKEIFNSYDTVFIPKKDISHLKNIHIIDEIKQKIKGV